MTKRVTYAALAAMAIAAAMVVGCRDSRVDALQARVDAIQSAPMGASAGYLFVGGEQRYQQYTRAREYAVDWVAVPAGTWTQVFATPTIVSGELSAYAGIAFVTYNMADASTNCDAGGCDGVIRRYIPGRYQGGDFCRPDGVCANVDAGAIDVAEDSYVTTAGVMAGAQARIAWSSPSLIMQVYCPVACWSAAGISGRALKPVPGDSGVVDSGSDAADASDASDAADANDGADAGPAPTLSEPSGTILFALAGETETVHGTGFNDGTITCAIGGTAAGTLTPSTSGTCTGQTSGTCGTLPIPSGFTPFGAHQSLVCSNTTGASGSVSQWVPDNIADCPEMFVPNSDYETLVSGVISSWSSMSLTYAATQATSGDRPSPNTSQFSTGAPAIHFSGAQWLAAASFPSQATGSAVAWVDNFDTSLGGARVAIAATTGSDYFYYNGGTSRSINTGSVLNYTGFATGVVTRHWFDVIGASGKIYFNGAAGASGTTGTNGLTGGIDFGGQGSSFPYTGYLGPVAICSATPTSTQLTNWEAATHDAYGNL
jgi:hypothetical protein